MALQIQGNGGTVLEVGANSRAARVEQRPIDYGALGSYKLSMLSGTMAAGLAANSDIFQFRWSAASNACVVRRVTLDGLSGSATAFAAGFGKVDLMFARSFTASGTGGTAVTLGANDTKLRTNMGSTTISSGTRIASTAALGTGTRTLDAQAIGQISLSFGVAASVQYTGPVALLGEDAGVEQPVVLAQNEGLVVRATVPATGTWQFGVTVAWTEIATF